MQRDQSRGHPASALRHVKNGGNKLTKIFVDGGAGTTGLRIRDRLSSMEEVEIIVLPEEKRKDAAARKNAINSSDVTFLCLPDAAAVEAAALAENPDTVIIDASTAHRTNDEWAYGLPELSEAHMQKIKNSKRIAVPGCHASGFITLVYPLIESGIISQDAFLSCNSVTGYSGGGKSMISDYEADKKNALLTAPRLYGVGQSHKHLPEMKKITGLEVPPVFSPIVSDFYSGMLVTVPLCKNLLNKGFTADDIRDCYKSKYRGPVVKYVKDDDEKINKGGFISAASLSDTDSMYVTVFGNDERFLLAAVYDNLGKGASGAAVECMNIVTGRALTSALRLV